MCGQYDLDQCGDYRRQNGDLCTSNCSNLSTSSEMSKNVKPTLVYKRMRSHKNPVSVSEIVPFSGTKPSDGVKESSNGDEPGSEEALLSGNCSSSKSNECSTSGALITEKIPERDKCGLFGKVYTRRVRDSFRKSTEPCKLCGNFEGSSKVLQCDNCENSFHISCCDPHITKVPPGEWYCSSCLKKKKHKTSKENSTSLSNISTEGDASGNSGSDSECELGSVFRELEMYRTSVRIGDEFQANVPDWSGPIDDASHLIGDPLSLDSSNNFSAKDRSSTEDIILGSIGNWLQCQAVVEGIGEGVDETICGKWRRAPLFEVQTDDWECFDCVLWDQAHSDCAVPQELETEEVMKQLKYINMLRPQFSVKRRKVNRSKKLGSKRRVK